MTQAASANLDTSARVVGAGDGEEASSAVATASASPVAPEIASSPVPSEARTEAPSVARRTSPDASSHAVTGWSVARLVAAVALVGLCIVVGHDAWRDIWGIAVNDEESSHIFLVPLIVAWLVWNRRDEWNRIQPRTSLVGPVMIALGGAVNAYGFYDLNQAFWHGGAVLMAIGGFITIVGWRVLWRFLPVFIVLAFLVPVPGMIRQEISIPLQSAVAWATAMVYQALALPIVRHGNVLHFHGQDIAVAEACNGMRMVFALLLVTYAVAFATPLRNWVRGLLLAVSPLFAILCNVIRLLPTVWFFGYYPKTVGPVFHSFSGWIMIAVAFLMVLGVIHVLRWAEIPIMKPRATDAAAAV